MLYGTNVFDVNCCSHFASSRLWRQEEEVRLYFTLSDPRPAVNVSISRCPLKPQTKIPEDYTKFYNHVEGPFTHANGK